MANAQRIELTLRGWLDPAEVFVRLFADEDDVFWLDSGAGAVSGQSVMGRSSRTVVADLADDGLRVSDNGVPVAVRSGAGRGSGSSSVAGSVFDLVRDSIGRTPHGTPNGPDDGPRGPLGGGWVGWLGYEAGASASGVPVSPTETPDAVLLRAEDVVVFDHVAGRVVLSSESGEWVDDTVALLGEVVSSSGSAVERLLAERVAPGGDVVSRWDAAQYRSLVEACQERITAGDAYQLCLTNELRIAGAHDPLATYLRLRASSPSHHGGFIRAGGAALLSASPEQFLEIGTDRVVRTKPIKGTRPRGDTPERDEALRAELLASEKERAENLMIVDLMRNDLARVSEGGTVTVTALHVVESYPPVHQLVSTIEGRLRNGVGVVDAVEACFPAGSMTGAPKRSAMTILHGLERGSRGVYAGAFGAFWDDGSTDLAMVIRSIVIREGMATIGTGGGITALSVPAEELAETRTKARALLAALGIEGDAQESR